MKKSGGKKTNNLKFVKFIKKIDVKRFNYKILLQDFKFMKSVVKIMNLKP